MHALFYIKTQLEGSTSSNRAASLVQSVLREVHRAKRMASSVQFLERQITQISSLLLRPSFLYALIPLFFTYFIVKRKFAPKNGKNFPPSPAKLPLLGHLHKLGIHPHQSLQKLAQKYGPVMFLQLGSIKTVVISSPEGAKEIMKTQDLNFANRPIAEIPMKLLYDQRDVGMAVYGEYWRQMKSICVLQLLSNKRVQSFRSVRQEETENLVKQIRESSGPVNLSDLFMALTNHVVCRAAVGRKYSEGESGANFRQLMTEFVSLVGGFEFGTFLPSLKFMDRLNGLTSKVEDVGKRCDQTLEQVYEEHDQNQKPAGDEAEDFADVLLGIHKNSTQGFHIPREGIKGVLMDIFLGGTDTTYTVLEWAMTELLRNPACMRELKNEVTKIANGRDEITEDDLKEMPYLKAVIREAMRLHPPLPLLVPREAIEDAKVLGYDIEKGTRVIINAYAISRSPAYWDEPLEFKPERFLNSSIDFRGHDFELIPFGSGRRVCPGIEFATTTNENSLANLVLKFDWELPKGVKPSDVDMTECTGLAIHRKVPLYAVATPTK